MRNKDDNYSSTVNILYASDDGYAPLMLTSMLSAADHVNGRSIDFYIMDCGISEKRRQYIEQYFDDTDVRVVFERFDPEHFYPELTGKLKTDRGSVSQYLRIFFQHAVDDSVHRILYLDCDTLVVDDLQALYDKDLSGNIAGAVKDAVSSVHKMRVGYTPGESMFNSGMMLINVDLWRSRHIERRLADILFMTGGRIPYADQGALNIVLRGSVKFLHPRYNVMSYFYDLSYRELMICRKPRRYYSRKAVSGAVSHPCVLHFITIFTSVRPWYRNSDAVMKYYFLSWYRKAQRIINDKSPDRLYRPSGYRKVLMKLYHVLPRSFVIRLYGILHSYIFPFFKG